MTPLKSRSQEALFSSSWVLFHGYDAFYEDGRVKEAKKGSFAPAPPTQRIAAGRTVSAPLPDLKAIHLL